MTLRGRTQLGREALPTHRDQVVTKVIIGCRPVNLQKAALQAAFAPARDCLHPDSHLYTHHGLSSSEAAKIRLSGSLV